MSFSKRPNSDSVCYTKPIDSLTHWNDHFFWVDSFACPTSFPWHNDQNISRDPFPKLTEFNADDYAILVAHPAPFQKFPEPFLCLVGMICNYTLDEDTYPSFLHDDGTDMDLFAFIQVADPTKVKVVERERDKGKQYFGGKCGKLFDEGGSTKQGDSAAGSGHDGASLRILDAAVKDTAAGNATAERPRRQRQKSEAATGGKSPSVLKELLASSILNVEAGVKAVATLPLVTSSVSATLEREVPLLIPLPGSIFAPSVHPKGLSVAPPPVMTEAVITTNIASIPSVPAPETGTKVISSVHASMFHDSDFMWTVRPDQWNVSNDTLIDDHDASRIRTEYYLSERKRLEYLSALGATISRAIEKGMQDGMLANIVHGKEGRSLADVAAYNHADASVEDIMNLLRLEGPLVDAPGMSDLQPNVDQLMLPVNQSEDQVVLAETSLSFALMGAVGTSDSVPATVVTATALSTTFDFASSIPPITIEDYEVVGTDGLEDA
ncbi:hypothetical protein Tco_1399700 [Tanacetum coccineum]